MSASLDVQTEVEHLPGVREILGRSTVARSTRDHARQLHERYSTSPSPPDGESSTSKNSPSCLTVTSGST